MWMAIWSHSFSIFLFSLNSDYSGNKTSGVRILSVVIYKEIIMYMCYLACLSHLPWLSYLHIVWWWKVILYNMNIFALLSSCVSFCPEIRRECEARCKYWNQHFACVCIWWRCWQQWSYCLYTKCSLQSIWSWVLWDPAGVWLDCVAEAAGCKWSSVSGWFVLVVALLSLLHTYMSSESKWILQSMDTGLCDSVCVYVCAQVILLSLLCRCFFFSSLL